MPLKFPPGPRNYVNVIFIELAENSFSNKIV